MESDSRTYWIIMILLIGLAAFFAAAETALAAVSPHRIRGRAEQGDPRAEKAVYLLENFNRTVTTLLICINIVHIAAASISAVLVTEMFGFSALTAGTLVTTAVLFFFGEMLPKSMAAKIPEKTVLFTAPCVRFFLSVFRPFSALLARFGAWVARHITAEPEATVTEEELQDMIEDFSEEGKIDTEQAEIFSQALVFPKKRASEIMTGIGEVLSVDIGQSPEEIMEFVRNQKHSRIPVTQGSRGNIIGMLEVRKLFRAWLEQKKAPEISALLSEVYHTEPDVFLDELLDSMSREKATMAVVRNKGNDHEAIGILTVEDILEELFGEIYDERDSVPAAEKDSSSAPEKKGGSR